MQRHRWEEFQSQKKYSPAKIISRSTHGSLQRWVGMILALQLINHTIAIYWWPRSREQLHFKYCSNPDQRAWAKLEMAWTGRPVLKFILACDICQGSWIALFLSAPFTFDLTAPSALLEKYQSYTDYVEELRFHRTSSVILVPERRQM